MFPDSHTKAMQALLRQAIQKFTAPDSPEAAVDIIDNYYQQPDRVLAERAKDLRTFIEKEYADNHAFLGFAQEDRCYEGLKQARNEFLEFDRQLRKAMQGFQRSGLAVRVGHGPQADERLLTAFIKYVEVFHPHLQDMAKPAMCMAYLRAQSVRQAEGQYGKALNARERYDIAHSVLPWFNRKINAQEGDKPTAGAKVIMFSSCMRALLPGFSDDEAEAVIKGCRPPGPKTAFSHLEKISRLLKKLKWRKSETGSEAEPSWSYKEWVPEADSPKEKAAQSPGYDTLFPPIPRWLALGLAGVALFVGGELTGEYRAERRHARQRDWGARPRASARDDVSGSPRGFPPSDTPLSTPGYTVPTDGMYPPASGLSPWRQAKPQIGIPPSITGPSIRAMPPAHSWTQREIQIIENPKGRSGP